MMAVTIAGWTGLSSHAQPLDLPLSLWERLYTVRAGGGYKDNVTLSHTAPESSGFFASGVEFFTMGMPSNGSELTLFVTADDRRYFSSATVDGEQVVFVQPRVRKVFEEAGEISLSVDYAYQDQIQDVSVTETNREALRVRGHTLSGTPSLRLNFGRGYWAGVELVPTRQWLAEPLDDYFEFGARINLGKEYGRQSDLSLRYEPRRREYDTDPQLSAGGEAIPETHRAFNQHEVRLIWRHHWDAERQWRSSMRLSYLANTDNGSGYFDYNRLSASGQLRYKTKTWEISVDARVSDYQYAVQTVSATDSSRRERKELALGLRAERQLVSWLRLVGAFEHDQAFSNIRLENYRANTVSASLQWEF